MEYQQANVAILHVINAILMHALAESNCKLLGVYSEIPLKDMHASLDLFWLKAKCMRITL